MATITNISRRSLLLAPALALCLHLIMPHASAGLVTQTPVDVYIELGNPDNELRFFPDHIDLEAGKLYRLTLHNPSPSPHYFSSPEFVRNIFTQKILTLSPEGTRISEVKGMILELEVYPGGTAQWWFVPVRDLSMGKLLCNLANHAEQGMVGRITIK